jgi:hypothetical protein
MATYSWKTDSLTKIKDEEFSPSIFDELDYVILAPSEFQYQMPGSTDSWVAFGNWYFAMNKGLDSLPPYEKEVVQKLIKGTDDKREIISRLYHYLQDETRYINVAIDEGGLKPLEAEYVCRNKYGDCKALTIYMKALLAEAGIPSYYTLIRSGDIPRKIIKEVPNQMFNHVILGVPLDGDTLYLENTSTSYPMGFIGTSLQNREAFWVDKDRSKFVQIPALKPSDNLVVRKQQISVEEDGAGEAKVSLSAGGEVFELLNYLEKNLPIEKYKDFLEDYVELSGHTVNDFSIKERDRDDYTIEISMECNLSNLARKVGKLLVLQPTLFSLPEAEESDDRLRNLYFPTTIFRIDTTVYMLENKSKYIVTVPEDISISSRFGDYSVSFSSLPEGIQVVSRFQLLSDEYDASLYAEFVDFVQEAKEKQSDLAIIYKTKT